MIYFFESNTLSSNSIFITGENILVDPGMEPEKLEKRLLQKGITKIDKIVNTHCHFDHTLGNKHFAEKYGLTVYAFPPDSEHIRKGNLRYTYMRIDKTEVIDLKEGKLFDTDFEVIHTPGHTEGSICLYNHADKALISGDTIFAKGFGRTDLPGGNASKMKESLKKLKMYEFEVFYPGHGPMGRNSNI